MEYWYLSEQLQKFHAGIRGQNPENRSEYLMGIGTRKIVDQIEIAYLADWFAKQEPKPAIRTIQGDKVLGKKLYEQRCVQCHGERAEGNLKAEILPWIARKVGILLNRCESLDPEKSVVIIHKMNGGKVMATASKELADWDLKNLIFY